MAQIKKAKDALCMQIVDLYVLRDYLREVIFPKSSIADEVEKKIAGVILLNRDAYKSLV